MSNVIGKVNCVIAGAGVVGLSVARRLCISNVSEVIILEAKSSIGQGISSRNSEVIHGGVYYPNNSLKASLCVQGRKLLYDYVMTNDIPFRKCGKFIVATVDDDCEKLDRIFSHALQNGVEDMKILSGDEARELEPNLSCVRCLWSPHTGILDSHTLMQNLLSDAENNGASLVLNCAILGANVLNRGNSILVRTNQGDIECNVFVNAAGLYAPWLAARLEGFPSDRVPYSFFCKGSYFKLKGSSPFSRLVYPIPSDGGLGIHATLDLGGATRFGPDTEWLQSVPSAIDSTACLGLGFDETLLADPNLPYVHTEPPPDSSLVVDPHRADLFSAAIRKYWPDLPDDALVPDYAGIRPKLCGPYTDSDSSALSLVRSRLHQQSPSDFYLQGPSEHGVQGVYNLFGVESPGLTSCLAIADLLADKIQHYKLPTS